MVIFLNGGLMNCSTYFKKIFLVSISLIATFPAWGMSLQEAITSKQSVLMYNKNSGRQHGIEFIRGASYNFFADQQKRDSFRAMLLTDPAKFLADGEKSYAEVDRQYLEQQSTIQQEAQLQKRTVSVQEESNLFERVITQALAKNPFSGIRECTTEWCPLSRLAHPERRDAIEKFIISDITTRHPNKNQALTISFFYPGDFLSELIIVTCLLEKGYTNLSINLVSVGLAEEK
jgi:hypothetical protein